MPLYAASSEWEYMTVPEQSGKRLGNQFYFNRYGMRCQEVDSTKKHVLGLGDSVINGGVQTDQNSLATSLFSAETGTQMLNVSAGSWGPDNCAAFLCHYGLFNAKGMFLLVSSHDAHDNMDFVPVVGVQESYPDKQYCCAIVEVVCRYIYPRYMSGKYNEQGQEIIAWCLKNGVKLIKDIDSGFTLDDYRDDIHINAKGQRKLASVMEKAF